VIEFRKPRISVKQIADLVAEFTVEPLERGFGYTLGNTMRRILLSSLPGAAVSSVRIDGVSHEFSTIPNTQEDVSDIVLNLKKLVLRLHNDEPATMRIKAKGPKEVKAEDIVLPSDVEIVNPDLHIATLNKKGKLEMEIVVEKGRGYVSAERNKKPTDPIGVIPVDSLFSPTRKVIYRVENTRVGQRTDYDKLIMTVETNGSLTPDEAVSLAAKIMNEHMNLFIDRAPEEASTPVFAPDETEKAKILDSPIEELEFSVRSYNCLKKEGINTLEQLISRSEADLLNIRNFGAKSIDEIKGKLNELELSLKG
jgi:DNA-directed RNA polymerase subunit alpha